MRAAGGGEGAGAGRGRGGASSNGGERSQLARTFGVIDISYDTTLHHCQQRGRG